MNLNPEAGRESADNLQDLATDIKDELNDEIFEIADANVRRRMSQMRMRKRSMSSGVREPKENDSDQSRSVSVSNFSVRRTSAISMVDEEQQILQKVLAKRTESISKNTEQSKAPATKPGSKKKPLNVRIIKTLIN